MNQLNSTKKLFVGPTKCASMLHLVHKYVLLLGILRKPRLCFKISGSVPTIVSCYYWNHMVIGCVKSLNLVGKAPLIWN